MAKTKKVSINEFEKYFKASKEDDSIVKIGDMEITVKRTLDFDDMISFVIGVVDSCFVGDEDIFMPEVKEFAIKSNVLSYYANMNLPEDLNKRYQFIMCTDVYDEIINYIDAGQFNNIRISIDEKIDHRCQVNIDSVNKKIEDIKNTVENMISNIENVFSGINNEDLSELINAITNGKLDEDKLVEAYIKQKSGD
ncbi:MAG: hypothetical protein KBS82_05635 [Oscillospiraceae bacterium]|nr:hypothetical protein [Candidatus Limimonas egerieequi]